MYWLLLLLGSVPTLSPEPPSLKSAVVELPKRVGLEKVNCFEAVKTADNFLKSFKPDYAEDQAGGDNFIEKIVLSTIDEGRFFVAISVLLHLPDLVAGENEQYANMIPAKHGFVVIADSRSASLCQSWEHVQEFRCSPPSDLPEFKNRLVEMQHIIREYLAHPTLQSHDRFSSWFLGSDTKPQFTLVRVDRELLERTKSSEAVRFFVDKLRLDQFGAYFNYLVKSEPRSIGQQLELALLAGQAVSFTSVLKWGAGLLTIEV